MLIFHTFHFSDYVDTLFGLILAFALGTAIGAERQYRQRSAGLRTNVLVALGACEFVDIAMNLDGGHGAVKVISYVVSGIGFLGAGVIMKDGLKVRGLNTAATLWCSAAVGACAGANLAAQAVTLTIFVIGANTLLLPLVNAINRRPVTGAASEATYEVSVMTTIGSAAGTRKKLIALLQTAHYPVGDVELIDRGAGVTEVLATLVSTAVVAVEMDSVVSTLEQLAEVTNANWSSSIE
jgi:putative Mg2+ transporter-C (MgtC) family protein